MATINIDAATLQSSITGLIDTARTAGRVYMRGDRSFIAFKFTGDGLAVRLNSNFGTNPELVVASVDGGAFFNAPKSGGTYTVLSGGTDTEHDVVIYIGAAYGTAPYLDLAETSALIIDGASPQFTPHSSNYTPINPELVSSAYTIPSGDSYIPTRHRYVDTAYRAYQALLAKTSATEIKILTRGTEVLVSTDGGGYVKHAVTNRVVDLTLSAGSKRLNIWTKSGDIVAIYANDALIKTGSRLDQYGDSITVGNNSIPGYVEIHATAAHFGRLGNTFGSAGITVEQLNAAMPTILAGAIIESGDIAVLAVGRNSTSGILTAPTQAEYVEIIDKLLAAGYSKVLARGIIPDSGGSWAAQNTVIQGLADAHAGNVEYVDVSGWVGIDTPPDDGVHPTETGYLQMTEYAKVSYESFIPAPSLPQSVSTSLGLDVGL